MAYWVAWVSWVIESLLSGDRSQEPESRAKRRIALVNRVAGESDADEVRQRRKDALIPPPYVFQEGD